MLLNLFPRLCNGYPFRICSFIGHILNAPIVVFLYEGITCPEPMPVCLFIDDGCPGKLWQGIIQGCIIHLNRPASLYFLQRFRTACAEWTGQPDPRLLWFALIDKVWFQVIRICLVCPGIAALNPLIS